MQQINLYQSQFKPKQVILPPRQMLLIISAVILILCVMSIYSIQRNVTLEHIVSNQKQPSLPEIDLIIEFSPLETELKLLQSQYDDTQRLLEHLTHHDFGNQHGFSASLENLAYHRINNVWLTSFSFFNGGKVISLKGQALNSNDIPSYLDNLSNAQGFQGKKFSVFQLEQPEDESGFYSFQLHTDSNNGR